MPLFKVPQRASKQDDRKVAGKAKMKAQPATSRSTGVLDTINRIRNSVDVALGKYTDEYTIIRSESRLTEYLLTCLQNGIVAIDTETTGLDPIEDKLVGICLYTPNEKPAYIPVNHVSYITGDKVDDQLSEEYIAKCFKSFEIAEDLKIIMFNAKFDIRVLRNQLGVYLKCYWDCYLASRLMNENEPHKGLKALHQKYVLEDAEDEFKFDALFKGITFDKVPIDCAYLYAAHDALITYELYEFQKKYLYYDATKPNEDRNGMNGVAWVFFNIEMPCVNVICDMEDAGIELDINYAKELSIKYTALLDAKIKEFHSELSKYTSEIELFRKTAKNAVKLEDPINIASPTQVAILLYDILKVNPPDQRSPRGTGEAILLKINHPISKLILEYRGIEKLLSTYIDKLPGVVHKDGRIHCNFNQYGADTGRMSSSDPNLQNIPSHNKEIRKMFKASNGYLLLSSDFSQQEPKCLAALCRKQGDSQMYDTFMAGKDLYSEIASKAFNKPYEDCLEFRPDGTTSKEGKERRTQAKSILLGRLNKMPLMLAIA